MTDNLEKFATAASEMAVDFSIKHNNSNNTGLSCERMLDDAKKIHDFLIGESHHFKEEDFELPFSKEDIKEISRALKDCIHRGARYGNILWKREYSKLFFQGVHADYNEDRINEN